MVFISTFFVMVLLLVVSKEFVFSLMRLNQFVEYLVVVLLLYMLSSMLVMHLLWYFVRPRVGRYKETTFESFLRKLPSKLMKANRAS